MEENSMIREWFSEHRDMRYISGSLSKDMGRTMKKDKLLEIRDGVIFANEATPIKLLN